MNLAVILPSRGLIFSATIEELLSELKGIPHTIFWSHGRPIPDCFEIPTQEALKGDFSHLLIVEEDMILPKGCIGDMLDLKLPAVTYDYPVSSDKYGVVVYDGPNSAYFSGTGLLLVKMDIVRRMVFPIWRSDTAWEMVDKNGIMEFTLVERTAGYGQQDIAFGIRLYINEIPLYVMSETTGQRKLVKRGADGVNDGSHEIVEYNQTIKQELLSVKMEHAIIPVRINNEIHHLWGPQAEQLIDKGVAKRVAIRNAEFYNIESLEEWLWLK